MWHSRWYTLYRPVQQEIHLRETSKLGVERNTVGIPSRLFHRAINTWCLCTKVSVVMSRPPIRVEDKSLLSSKWKYVLFTQSLTFSNNSGTRGGLQATVTGRGMLAKKIFDVKKSDIIRTKRQKTFFLIKTNDLFTPYHKKCLKYTEFWQYWQMWSLFWYKRFGDDFTDLVFSFSSWIRKSLKYFGFHSYVSLCWLHWQLSFIG